MRNQSLVLAAVLAMGLVACGDDEATRGADRDRNDATEEAEADNGDEADDSDAGDAGDAAPAADETADGGEASPTAPGALIDSDAAALMAVFDDHVVEAAKLVQARGAAVQVKDLAKALEATHASLRGKISRLERGTGPVTAHDQVNALAEKFAGQRALIVDSPDGAPLDVAFLESMIASHTEVLALIDARLLPGARQDPVREHLGTARTAIAADLDKAQSILADY